MTSATPKLVRRQKRLPNTQSSLKTFLYRMLKDTGDLDSLKVSKPFHSLSLSKQSQIRQRMILELKERNQTTVHMNGEIDFGREEPDMYQDLVNCLFMDHLQTCDYLYTLSVFLPECGLTNYKV
ncbi:oral-facial-digital syndrome 1 protein, partial [Clonorchis sinensis]